MPDIIHKNFSGADAVHPFAFVQSSDPGAVGPNLCWIDTSVGPPYTLKLRNSLNTAWLLFAAGIAGSTGPTGAIGPSGPNGITTVTGAAPYICMQDRKPSGTDGGTFTSGADRTRTLNTFIANDQNLAVLSNNQITLPAGTWRTSISCPAYACDQNVAWLYNVTGGGILVQGQANQGTNSTLGLSFALIKGRFTLASTSVLEVRHRCRTTQATNGLGTNSNSFFTVPYEVYTVAEFWLEGGPPPFFGTSGVTEDPSLGQLAGRRLVAGQTYMPHSPLTAPQ